jgi:class 3 adenylate cyclase
VSSGDPGAKPSWWTRVSQLGIVGLSTEEERKTRLLNQCSIIAAVTLLSFTIGYWTDPARFAFGLVANLGAAALQLSVLWLVARGLRSLALGLFLLVCNLQLAAVCVFLGPDVGYQYYFFAFAAVVFLVTPRGAWFFYPFSAISVAGYLYFTFVMAPSEALVTIDSSIALLAKVTTIVTTFGTLVLLGYLFDADTRHAEERLAAEHARSEALLLNILPASISRRLKSSHGSIADGFADVSVLFADIVGFTELSARMPPGALVEVLNDVFSSFDDLGAELGLEKIKTIGDAYMAAAGLPEPRADHADIAVRMALGMKRSLDEMNRDKGYGLSLRIGIHSGPVVAGVIGKRKFIYDLWGDTVNTASRMESHGVKDAVHVSEATAKLVEARFELEPRGTIQVKGKGEMVTFVVRGERQSA